MIIGDGKVGKSEMSGIDNVPLHTWALFDSDSIFLSFPFF